jgi:hypothetical protein
MGRKTNDGNHIGLKQDRFRDSIFEIDSFDQARPIEGASEAGPNVLGNIGAENRGRRGDQLRNHKFNADTPFENGRLTNWGNRHDWDKYFYEKSFRPGRQGGGIIGDDKTNHSGHGPKGYKRLDENIYEDVCEALTASPAVDASAINVEVKDGCVYLTGNVDSRFAKREAEWEIADISGITDVQNQLIITASDI